ncbi:MAG: hypothetical protein QOC94_4956 [Actinoplanes sp.]|nr:hypothetical protein [Actinoplanes sp.]
MTTSPASMPAGAADCSGSVVRPLLNQERCRRKRPGGSTIYGRRRRKAPPSAPAPRPARRVPVSLAELLQVPTATWRTTAGGLRRGAPSRIRESGARPGHPPRQGSPVRGVSRLEPLPFRNPRTATHGRTHSQVHRPGPGTPRAQLVAAWRQAGLPGLARPAARLLGTQPPVELPPSLARRTGVPPGSLRSAEGGPSPARSAAVPSSLVPPAGDLLVRGRLAVVRPVATHMTEGLAVHAKPAGRHVELRHPGARPTAASEIKSGPGRAVRGSTAAGGRPRVHGTRHLTTPSGTTPFRSPGRRSSRNEARGRAGAPSILAG